MILLDTDVVSELMKVSPAAQVIGWLNQQESSYLFISTITVAEISYGIHALPAGKRRDLLEEAFSKAIQVAFKYRLLSFDESAAHHYGKLMSDRKELGHPLSILNGQIAAIACAHKMKIATRNIRDFSKRDLELINPWL